MKQRRRSYFKGLRRDPLGTGSEHSSIAYTLTDQPLAEMQTQIQTQHTGMSHGSHISHNANPRVSPANIPNGTSVPNSLSEKAPPTPSQNGAAYASANSSPRMTDESAEYLDDDPHQEYIQDDHRQEFIADQTEPGPSSSPGPPRHYNNHPLSPGSAMNEKVGIAA